MLYLHINTILGDGLMCIERPVDLVIIIYHKCHNWFVIVMFVYNIYKKYVEIKTFIITPNWAHPFLT